MTTSTYRRNITKSKSGHYHLTLIDKRTGLRQTGRFGWGTPETAKAQEETYCTEQLAERVARLDSLRDDQQRIANAAAAALDE